MMDLGSGCLVDLSPYGLAEEITVQEVLAKGVDVVSFSGDKLLGGPQAGILAGPGSHRKNAHKSPSACPTNGQAYSCRSRSHSREYTRPEGPAASIPTLAMITRSQSELARICGLACRHDRKRVGDRAEVSIEPGIGRVGGGALPMGDLPGPRVAIHPRQISAAVWSRGSDWAVHR